jgi:hypothetical protein
MVSDWNCLKYFCVFFCTVIIRCTETFWSPCIKTDSVGQTGYHSGDCIQLAQVRSDQNIQINTLMNTWVHSSNFQPCTADITQCSYKYQSVISKLHPTSTQTYNKHMKGRNADSVLSSTPYSIAVPDVFSKHIWNAFKMFLQMSKSFCSQFFHPFLNTNLHPVGSDLLSRNQEANSYLKFRCHASYACDFNCDTVTR